MHLEGSHQLAASPEAVWKLLNDPDVLAKLTPGLAELKPQEKEDSYEAVFQIKMGPINSGFKGTLEVRDKSEPLSYRLVIGVKGRIGTVDAEGTIALADAEVRLIAGAQSAPGERARRVLREQHRLEADDAGEGRGRRLGRWRSLGPW